VDTQQAFNLKNRQPSCQQGKPAVHFQGEAAELGKEGWGNHQTAGPVGDGGAAGFSWMRKMQDSSLKPT